MVQRALRIGSSGSDKRIKACELNEEGSTLVHTLSECGVEVPLVLLDRRALCAARGGFYVWEASQLTRHTGKKNWMAGGLWELGVLRQLLGRGRAV